VNNGEIATAVCPLVHGLEIIKDPDGLECRAEENRSSAEESGSRIVTSTETEWMGST